MPETSEYIENKDFIEINGKTRMVEEIFFDDPQRGELSEQVPTEGELVYGVDDLYSLF